MKLKSLFLAAVLLAATPWFASAGEIYLLPGVKLQIGDRDHRGHRWDGHHWRDRNSWNRDWRWHDGRWHHRNAWRGHKKYRHHDRRHYRKHHHERRHHDRHGHHGRHHH